MGTPAILCNTLLPDISCEVRVKGAERFIGRAV